MPASRRAALLLCCIALVAAAGPAAGAVAGPAGIDDPGPTAAGPGAETGTAGAPADPDPVVTTGATRSAAESGTLDLSTELFLTPETPGEIRATTSARIPDNLAGLTLTLDERASIVETDGFTQTSDRGVEWDEETRPASVTYTLRANETGQSEGPEGAGGQYLFADVGDWALVERPTTALRYRYRGSISVSRTASAGSEGLVGTDIAYLGAYEAASREAHGQTLHLVVPRAATLAPTRRGVYEAVAGASDMLRVGNRDPSVYMFAAPTAVDWGVEGLQVGDTDFYVTADERLDRASNTWLHEYVHTRQNLSLASEARWFQEASATYYAALVTLEQERIGFAAFRDALERGTRSRYSDVVLSDPGTWTAGAEYDKGALVAGDLDRRIRLATDSGATLQTIFSRMNGAPTSDGDDLLADLERTGGTAVSDAGRRFTTTTATPEPWSLEAHQAAFGQVPARIEVGLPARTNASAWRVAGAYRNGTLDPADIAVVPGETVIVDVPVTNAGGTTGDYAFDVRYGGERIASHSGTVPPETTVWQPVTVTPERTGTRTLSVGGETASVRVADPAPLAIGDLTVNRSTVAPGAAVGVSVGVGNEADVPGESTVTVAADGTSVLERAVRLGPRGSATVTGTVRFDAPGDHTLSVGDASVTVTVGGEGADGSAGGGGDGTTATVGVGGAGFGPGVALVGAFLLAAGALWRRRYPAHCGGGATRLAGRASLEPHMPPGASTASSSVSTRSASVAESGARSFTMASLPTAPRSTTAAGVPVLDSKARRAPHCMVEPSASATGLGWAARSYSATGPSSAARASSTVGSNRQLTAKRRSASCSRAASRKRAT